MEKIVKPPMEQVLEDDGYSQFKTWTKTDRLLEDKNWMTFKKWAKKTWDGKARTRYLFKAALKLNMVESGLSVAEYFEQVPRESTTEREVYDRRR